LAPIRNRGWRPDDTYYASGGGLYCDTCGIGRGLCACQNDTPRNTHDPAQYSRPGAVWRVRSDSRRTHVEVRAWKGSVSGSRWASRIGASLHLLTSDPRTVDLSAWSAAYGRYMRPFSM